MISSRVLVLNSSFNDSIIKAILDSLIELNLTVLYKYSSPSSQTNERPTERKACL
ncbi:hypothetical protein SDC9_140333 [bioreactor metagenome]|uniref:Uncharacterized protein n=1 Tax=bioreactor metagenome TaxID=1076179 RepID=A0A645DUY5_9ZZZZ